MSDFSRGGGLLSLGMVIVASAGLAWGDDTGVGANILTGDFETGLMTYNPWAGVDDAGRIHVWAGSQMAVSDSGRVGTTGFSPSVAVGDLNGDGLPDLVVADARGFFWYFPNSGKPGAPAFTHGEVIPIWLGEGLPPADVVPRIQLVDFDGDRKLDIVAGDFAGRLFYFRNQGSTTQPDFRMPTDLTSAQVFTHSKSLLWCNYLSPFLYDWNGRGVLDLLMGDGTYSANSIYLFTNMGSSQSPTFNESHMVKIIPGMGREHLTPQVVDWNADGKPDIICGERTGYVDVYVNQATDKTGPPVFDKDNPEHVLFGTTDRIGALTTVCAADLNKDKLFDLAVGDTTGVISYSLNTGALGSPKFGPLLPFSGVNPYPKITVSRTWSLARNSPYGAPYEVLESVNAASDTDFTPPPDFPGKSGLKFSVLDAKPVYFKNLYYPRPPYLGEDIDRRMISYFTGFRLKTDTEYILSFWVRGTGEVNNFSWKMWLEQPPDKPDKYPANFEQAGHPINVGNTWYRVTERIEIPTKFQTRNAPLGCSKLALIWDGDGTLYFDDFALKAAQ